MARDAGFQPQVVPPKVLFPLLEGASFEDNEDLHTMWAALLANAADPLAFACRKHDEDPGGYVLISVGQFANVCAARREQQISFLAFRVWLAAQEQCAKRCTAKRRFFTVAELARLVRAKLLQLSRRSEICRAKTFGVVTN